MALYNLIGRRRRHDVIDAVPLLAETLPVNVFCFNFSAYIRFFVNVLIEMNVNGPGSDKRDLKGIKVKTKVFKQKERTGFD